MDAGVLLAALYPVILGPLSLAVSDALFAAWAGERYLEVRAEIEEIVERLRAGSLSKRSTQRNLARLRGLRLELRRLLVARLLILLPVYVAAAGSLLVFARVPLRVSCCVPGFTLASGADCYTLPSLVAALSFIAGLPLLQEDAVVAALVSRRRRRRGS